MFGGKKENRFEEVYVEGALQGYKIIVDKHTGVNYLMSWHGDAGGITPLLDSNGQVVVTPICK